MAPAKSAASANADEAKPASANYHAHALARGLRLLELLAGGPQPITLTEFHRRTKLPKSTLVRLLSVLNEAEFVVRVDERPAFRLGHKVLALSTAYVSSLDVSATAGGYLEDLCRRTGHTGNLGMLDKDDVLHLAVREPDRPIRYTAMAGSRAAAYCTGLGKMLLSTLTVEEFSAHLPDEPFASRTESTFTTKEQLTKDIRKTQRRWYAFDDNEWSTGLRCLAVPIEIDGQCIAALSVAGPSAEFSTDKQSGLVEVLREVAAAMAADTDLGAVLRITHRSLSPVEPEAARK